MSQDLFVETLQKITTGEVGLHELIAAATRLNDAGHTSLAQQLYRVWLNFNGEHPQRFVPLFNCSVLSSQLGDVAAAHQELAAALAVNPEFLPAYINRRLGSRV